MEAFDCLKRVLTTTLIIKAPDSTVPFELMVIYYASKTLDVAQANYTTMENELLAIVFALDKFRSYLLGSHVIIFIDHAALKYLLKKVDSKPTLIRWMLWLQEFDLDICDRSRAQNLVVDHISRIERAEEEDTLAIQDDFPNENLLIVSIPSPTPWFANIVNYLVACIFPPLASRDQIDKLKSDAKHYVWDDPYLWNLCSDQVIRRCLLDYEIDSVLQFCHSSALGGYLGI
uniref:Retrovirus-related Pol polyprotein from transposon 17.6 n=1 Tax=Cajanus cajan TaxID=3821 RepID=A0A151RSE8_CAJCA|nr:Retrovirus-related Pol polyprotein from transposon 17.6 [Cajanus cajan]